jgi:hypothetical protein
LAGLGGQTPKQGLDATLSSDPLRREERIAQRQMALGDFVVVRVKPNQGRAQQAVTETERSGGEQVADTGVYIRFVIRMFSGSGGSLPSVRPIS